MNITDDQFICFGAVLLVLIIALLADSKALPPDDPNQDEFPCL